MSNGGFSDNETHAIDFLIDSRRSRTRRLTYKEKRAHVERFVKRSPEVVVRVSGGGKTLKHVRDHMSYITRNGKLEAIDDQGNRVQGKEAVDTLHDSWDLDAARGAGRYKQAFNIVLSMPAGTNPDRLLDAAQEFAREQFGAKHPYMMVLHTPDNDPHKNAPPHPHVHLVVRAESFEGQRLYIRKDTLEGWREDFASRLRARGIDAQATRRHLRGQWRPAPDIANRKMETGRRSRTLDEQFARAKRELEDPRHQRQPWERAIENRRQMVQRQLREAANELRQHGDERLAEAMEQRAAALPAVVTKVDAIKKAIVTEVQKSQQRAQNAPNKDKHQTKDR